MCARELQYQQAAKLSMLCNRPGQNSKLSTPEGLKNHGKGELDNHCTFFLKLSSDIKKISHKRRLLFNSQWIIQLILST